MVLMKELAKAAQSGDLVGPDSEFRSHVVCRKARGHPITGGGGGGGGRVRGLNNMQIFLNNGEE